LVEYLKSYNNPLNHWDKLYKKATFSFIIYFTLSFFLISPVLIPQGTISNRGQVLPISEADASFTGEAKDAWAGMPINEAGDVNGDGFDDFIISALGNGQNNNYTGQIYLIFGDAFGWGLHINLSSSNASFHGETSYDFAGFSINGGGDINGDGLDDILIGAPENSEGANHGGQTYLILGKEEGWEKNISLLNSDASFIGNQDINLLGYQVTLNGDVNGDGYDDIIISEPLANYKSKAHLFLGKPSGWKMDTSSKDSDVVFINEEFYNSESTIQHVISGGDVNGDGFDDILITTRQRDLGENWDSARVYLFLGHRNNWKDTNLSDADASFLGDGIIDCVGSSIAFLGDVK